MKSLIQSLIAASIAAALLSACGPKEEAAAPTEAPAINSALVKCSGFCAREEAPIKPQTTHPIVPASPYR